MPWPLNLPFLLGVAHDRPSLLLAPVAAVGAAHALVEVAAILGRRPPNRAGWMLPATAAVVAGVAATLHEQLPLLTAVEPPSPELRAMFASLVGIAPVGLTAGLLTGGVSAALSAFDARARPHAARLATAGASLLTLAALVEVLRGRVLLWWMQGRYDLVAVPGIASWTDGARAALLTGLAVLAVAAWVRRGAAATWTSTGLRLVRGGAIVLAGMAWQVGLGNLTGVPATLVAGDCVAAVGLADLPPFPCRKQPVAAIDAQMVSSARMPAPP